MIRFKNAMEALASVNAVLTDGHFVYASGKHGSAYVNKDAVYPYTRITSWLCWGIADQFRLKDVEVVVGPEKGGIILAQWVANHLSQRIGAEVLSVYAEKDGDQFTIKRGYEKLIPGKNVLIVEDVLTTGRSVRKVAEAVRAFDGDIIGVGALCNRGGVTEEDLGDPPVPLFSLLNIDLDSWEEDQCPLCAQRIPVNINVGKGREFVVGKSILAS